MKRHVVAFLLFLLTLTYGGEAWEAAPSSVLRNASPQQSLVNSVDFHPDKNLCCVTFTHNNRVDLYCVDEENGLTLHQSLNNPNAKLFCPQHAVFSKDGNVLVVANWSNETLSLYRHMERDFYSETPYAVIQYPQILRAFRPHGIAFSNEGNYLAVAFGASKRDPQGIALFRAEDLEKSSATLTLVDLLQNAQIAKGIPKGIAFSPDDACLVVTFANTDSVEIYSLDWTHEKISTEPKQVLKGNETRLSRPEDIKFDIDGSCCAVSNSGADTVAFYSYDVMNNRFVSAKPQFILSNPSAKLSFPHGLAFSSDGLYLAVTQFGPVKFNHNDDLVDWGRERNESIAIFKR